MSTHNIGFYEDFTKIIFELSSNIIKYAPYFFCWIGQEILSMAIPSLLLIPNVRRAVLTLSMLSVTGEMMCIEYQLTTWVQSSQVKCG